LTGGRYVTADWKRLAAGERPAIPEGGCYLSLVPTQLQRLLGDAAAVAWLRGFRAVFIGGGPAWPELVEAGAAAGLPLAFSYGMTETAAMVTALRPVEFLAGQRGCGRPLPHAQLTLDAEGVIAISAASLFRGYFPEARQPGPWLTADAGYIDMQGSLHVLGRRDTLIISGGEKIDPVEVEAVLRASGEFSDVAVVAVPDAEWGEAVVACYPAENDAPERERLEPFLRDKLARHKHPRHYVPVSAWPRNAQGKINREELRRVASATLHPAGEAGR
jgi:O-succinylbenzoic acid--CoA ligase